MTHHTCGGVTLCDSRAAPSITFMPSCRHAPWCVPDPHPRASSLCLPRWASKSLRHGTENKRVFAGHSAAFRAAFQREVCQKHQHCPRLVAAWRRRTAAVPVVPRVPCPAAQCEFRITCVCSWFGHPVPWATRRIGTVTTSDRSGGLTGFDSEVMDICGSTVIGSFHVATVFFSPPN